ncbi:hypothetical protein [Chitinimonas lacunae]|uniref:Uncharacterized protein n=1 Tax=Chitinimonas lacunae TaxID=1963018 RepID=A0ABV8MNB5_9NEIS
MANQINENFAARTDEMCLAQVISTVGMTAQGVNPIEPGLRMFDLHEERFVENPSGMERDLAAATSSSWFSKLMGSNDDGRRVVRVSQWCADGVARAGGRPLPAYWVPQGGYCDIPINPGVNDGQFVFTPDFSGCSILVDQLNANEYRVYHVQGGDNYFQDEYAAQQDHGMGLAGAMTFADYGLNDQPRAAAFLKHDGGRWYIYHQSQSGAPVNYNGKVVSSMTAQTIRQVRRTPVANLLREVPRTNIVHTNTPVPVPAAAANWRAPNGLHAQAQRQPVPPPRTL